MSEPSGEHGSHVPRIWHDIWFGLLIGAVILFAKIGFEKTTLGKLTEETTYEFLQHRLSLSSSSNAVPATVVDISGIEATGTGTHIYKARQPMLQLIRTIAARKPAAIAVDIEFSPRPDDHSPETPEDPDFFEACHAATEKFGVPVFLGVHNGASSPDPAGWLGLAEYQDLAANVEVPRDRQTKSLLRSLAVSEKAVPLKSLSAALADAYQKQPAEKEKEGCGEEHGWKRIRSLFVEATKCGKGDLKTNEYMVDYSSLKALRDGTIRATSAADLADQDEKLRGRVVLLGNADFNNLPPDSFPVPGQEQPIPGVYVHAAGATTLIGGPLFDVTETGRLVLDVLFALLVIGSVAAIRVYFERSGAEVSESRLQFVMTLLAVVAVILLGSVFVSWTRILWTDFLLVALTLWIHPALERDLPDLWRGMTGAGRTHATAPEKEVG